MKITNIRTQKFQDDITIVVEFDNDFYRSMRIRLGDCPEEVAYSLIELGKTLLDDMYDMTKKQSEENEK